MIGNTDIPKATALMRRSMVIVGILTEADLLTEEIQIITEMEDIIRIRMKSLGSGYFP